MAVIKLALAYIFKNSVYLLLLCPSKVIIYFEF